MLEKGEIQPLMIYGRYKAIRNEWYGISLRRELIDQILNYILKILKYFFKVISNKIYSERFFVIIS